MLGKFYLRQSVQKVLVFGILNFAHNLAECRLLFKIGTLYSLDVVEF
jgi:hypothetical protein